jgi:23S rRNA pseudouridine2605 synthase
MTAPARVNLLGVDPARDTTRIEITIHEGRNRQIRRMCEAIGHPVNRLKRVKFAILTLEGLRRGRFRRLTPDEVTGLKALVSPATE